MEVEVSIQDCFWSSFERSPQNGGTNVICPIPTETWEKWFQQWANIIEAELPIADSYELSLRLTGDEEMQNLNLQYRQQNKPTDVLAFAALEVDVPNFEELQDSKKVYLGDLVISVDTANRQAKEQGHPLKTELAWLAAHGFLHLLGWDHPDEESLRQMLNKQVDLLQRVGITVEAENS
jgi:probable rRNA maturation factor